VREVKEYIESGIIELYVLDQLSAEERSDVETMALKYPEIKKEIELVELAMEQYALKNAIEPSLGLDKKIIDKLNIPAEKIVESAKIIPLNIDYNVKIRTLRIALIACVTLLIASIALLLYSNNALNSAKNELAGLYLEKQKFSTVVKQMQQENTDYKEIAKMLGNQNWRTVKLSGTKLDPNANATVYWNTQNKKVLIDNSVMKLNTNDSEHQYQLWALVNGKPVDLGVFDVNTDTTQILLNMKEIAVAQTFAVTLEKRGGSINPTMTQLVLAGDVAL
jgi:anti-sigma-K factor RskA